MIRALYIDNLSRIKWLAVAYITIIASLSFSKFSILYSDTSIPMNEEHWRDPAIFSAFLVALSMIGWLVPKDRLTDPDSFWAGRPARSKHLIAAQTLALATVIVLPVVIGEALPSLLLGNIAISASAILQSCLFATFFLLLSNIILIGSRNIFKTIGITVGSGAFTIALASMARWSNGVEVETYNWVLTATIFSGLIAILTSNLVAIKQKSELWHLLPIVIAPAVLAAPLTIGTQPKELHISEINLERATHNPAIRVFNDERVPSIPNKQSVSATLSNTFRDQKNIFQPIEAQLVENTKNRQRVALNSSSSISGYTLLRDEERSVGIKATHPFELKSSNLPKQFGEDAATELEIIWAEYEVLNIEELDLEAGTASSAHGHLSRFTMSESYSRGSPEPAIAHGFFRPLSDFNLPLPYASERRSNLPAIGSVKRVYHVSYADGSEYFLTPNERVPDKAISLPLQWKAMKLYPRQLFARGDRPEVSSIYAIDLALMNLSKSSDPVQMPEKKRKPQE